MKHLSLIILLSFLTTGLWANCGNDNGNGNGCSDQGTPGPQGPKGDKGTNGSNGQNGLPGNNGSNGTNGKDGEKGADGQTAVTDDFENRLTVNLGAEVRWYDWKHMALASGYRYDVNHKGHTIDALVVQFKIGQSYENRQLEALNRKLAALEAKLGKVH